MRPRIFLLFAARTGVESAFKTSLAARTFRLDQDIRPYRANHMHTVIYAAPPTLCSTARILPAVHSTSHGLHAWGAPTVRTCVTTQRGSMHPRVCLEISVLFRVGTVCVVPPKYDDAGASLRSARSEVRKAQPRLYCCILQDGVFENEHAHTQS
jgi:hypothetical protein